MRPSRSARSLLVERRLGGLGLQPQLAGEAPELCAASAVGVARLLGADLAAGDLLAVGLQPRLDLRLLLGAGAQLAGEPLARAAVGDELGVEHLDARRGRRACAPSSAAASRSAFGASAASWASRSRSAAIRRAALGPLALRALGELALGGERGADLRAARGDRRVVGRLAALVDQVGGVALGLERLVAGARGGAGLAVGGVALARRPPRRRAPAPSTAASAACSACAAASTARISSSRRLRSASTRSSPPAGTWRSSRAPRRPHAPVAGDGDAVEAGVERVDVLDDPDAARAARRRAARRGRRPRR